MYPIFSESVTPYQQNIYHVPFICFINYIIIVYTIFSFMVIYVHHKYLFLGSGIGVNIKRFLTNSMKLNILYVCRVNL